MLMRIGNTVPNPGFRSLPGSAITGNSNPVAESITLRFGEGGTRSAMLRLDFGHSIAVRAISVLPWRW